MAGKDLRLRRTGIYAKLCRNFNAQAAIMSPDFDTTKMLAKCHPWISNHPWSKNGIPDSFDGLEFNIMRELREEFALMCKSYDPDTAYQYECAARDFERILAQQRNDDLIYFIGHATDEQMAKLDQAAREFFNRHFDNESSPYYGTYAPVMGMTMSLIISKKNNSGGSGPKGY